MNYWQHLTTKQWLSFNNCFIVFPISSWFITTNLALQHFAGSRQRTPTATGAPDPRDVGPGPGWSPVAPRAELLVHLLGILGSPLVVSCRTRGDFGWKTGELNWKIETFLSFLWLNKLIKRCVLDTNYELDLIGMIQSIGKNSWKIGNDQLGNHEIPTMILIMKNHRRLLMATILSPADHQHPTKTCQGCLGMPSLPHHWSVFSIMIG